MKVEHWGETRLVFMEESRALRIALELRKRGFGVLWTPENPNTVITSVPRATARSIAKETRGCVEDWYKHGAVESTLK